MESETNGKIPKLTPNQSSEKNRLDQLSTRSESEKVTGPLLTYAGFDINGLEATCSAKLNLKCPKILTPGDRFAAECEDQGYKSFKCDCYNYLCSEAIELDR